MARPKQMQMFPEEKDPQIVKIADRVIELMKESKSMKEKFEVQQNNLIGLMTKMGKAKIRHGGVIIEVKTMDKKEKLKIKEEKVNDLTRRAEGREKKR